MNTVENILLTIVTMIGYVTPILAVKKYMMNSYMDTLQSSGQAGNMVVLAIAGVIIFTIIYACGIGAISVMHSKKQK